MELTTRGEAHEVKTRLALASGVLVYGALVALSCGAGSEETIRLALRLQARLSFVLFLAVLCGPAAYARFRDSASSWVARERSALSQAFALSHLVHGAWLWLFFARTPNRFELNLVDGSGALAFVLIAALFWLEMPQAHSAPARWHARLRYGIWAYVWLQFIGFFAMRVVSGKRPELRAWYVLGVLSCLAAAWLAIRVRQTAPSADLRQN